MNRMRRTKRGASSEDSSFTIQQGALMAIIFVTLALTLQAAQPAWWTATGGPLNGNPANDYAVANQGQLKQFTQKAVLYLDTNLLGGAGTNLNNLIIGWSNYYATNGYSSTNPAPADFKAANQGQLKYIGNLIYMQLISQGAVTGYPIWIQGTNSTDYKVANLGQLKTVFNFDLTTYALSPHITSVTTESATVGVPISSYTITASNSPTSFSVNGLIPGLMLNTSTGVIMGTPTASGIFTMLLSATNSSGTGYATLTLTVNQAPPIILSATNASGVAGSPFNYTIVAANNPTNFSASTLPSGLSLNSTTGVIVGTPVGSSTNIVALNASNAGGTGTNSLLLAIAAPPVPVITSGTNATGNINSPFGYTVTTLNNPTNVVYTAGSLPTGLTLNTSSGVISGTPTALGSSTATLGATNAGGSASPVNLTITITPAGSPVITSGLTAYAFNGTSFSGYTVTASNSSVSYSASGLPNGLSINSSTGAISGTPSGYTGQSTVNATISATNSLGTGSASLIFTMNLPAPAITNATTATGYTGRAFSYTAMASNNPTSFSATGLPPGLSIDPNTGVISGTPTVPTSTPAIVTLGATNPGGTGTGTLTLTIGVPGPAPVISSGSMVSCILSNAFNFTITTSTLPGSFPTTFAYTGTLPGGLSLNPSTGVISGTPSGSLGNYDLTLSASNFWGIGYAPLRIIVNPATAPLITSTNIATGVIGSSFSYTITTINGVTSGGYSASALPAGLGINNSSGVISGTPSVIGTSMVTLGATNSLGAAVAPLTLTVNPPVPGITSPTTATGTFGVAINPYTITANNSPTSFGASGLPPGLQIDPSSGMITGTPAAAGSFSVTLSATNVTGTGTTTLTFVVNSWNSLPITTRSVASGYYHSLLLKTDGTVWGAGYNYDGEIGNGGNADAPCYVQITGLPPTIVAISSGAYTSMALASDGTVWTCGYNTNGQLGNGTLGSSYVPVRVSGLSGVIAISGGGYFNMALKSDGTVWAWGSGAFGQLGNGGMSDSSTPVQVQIAGGSPLTGVVSISAGEYHGLATKSDGTVWAWGYNYYNELGSNAPTNSPVAIQVPLVTGAVSAAAGGTFSFALKNDGTVMAWGDNSSGQLGIGTTGGTSGPILVPNLTGITAINATSEIHSLALKNDGTIWTWGTNEYGQLGNGTTTNSNVPIQVPNLTGVIALGTGDYHNIVLRTDGSVWGWGYIADYSEIGQATVAGQINLPPANPILGSVIKIASSGGQSMALKSDGTVWAWKDITPGQFGNGTTIVGSSTPVQVAGLSGITDIGCGARFNMALQGTGGSATLWAWGQNDAGQLGNGTTTDSLTPVKVTVSGGTPLTNIQAIAVGGAYTMALKSDGTVWTWGSNAYGQLGPGSGGSMSSVAVQSFTGASVVAAVSAHALVIKTDGTVWTWGSSWFGELGNGTPIGDSSFSSTPTQVLALTGTYIAVGGGYYHSMALKSDGTVWTWGANFDGQLGNGTGTNTTIPTQVPGLSGFVGINVGKDNAHSIARKSDGTIWAWGSNSSGQLGVGQFGPVGGTNASPTGSKIPVQMLGLPGTITSLAVGRCSTLALRSDGEAFEWGDISYEPEAFIVPVPVANLNANPGVLITPPPGSYTGSQTISISTALSGVSVHYTIDGTEPTKNSPLYSAPFSLTGSALVSATAFNTDGSVASPVANNQFYINDPNLTGLPTVATNLVVVPASTHELDVSWMLSGMTNYSRVNLYRSSNGGTTYPLIATMPPSTNVYYDTGLLSGSNYTYYVGTLNASGQTNTPPSSPVAPFTATNINVFITTPSGVTNVP